MFWLAWPDPLPAGSASVLAGVAVPVNAGARLDHAKEHTGSCWLRGQCWEMLLARMYSCIFNFLDLKVLLLGPPVSKDFEKDRCVKGFLLRLLVLDYPSSPHLSQRTRSPGSDGR